MTTGGHLAVQLRGYFRCAVTLLFKMLDKLFFLYNYYYGLVANKPII